MSKLSDLIRGNIEELPYEGEDVDMQGMEALFEDVLKGFLTYSKGYELTNKGYKLNDTYYSRQEIVTKFLNEKL